MDEIATKRDVTPHMKMVEIGGVKLEVDMRRAVKIEQFKVGDNVKVLKNTGYSDNPKWEIYPGVIAGFIQFKNRPTIVVAYLEHRYNSAEIKFANMNEDTKDIEIAPALPEELPMKEADVVHALDMEIQEKEKELAGAQSKKNYFMKHFKKYFRK